MQKVLFLVLPLLLTSCSARDYYMNLANNSLIHENQLPYILKIREIDRANARAEAQGRGSKVSSAYPVELGACLISQTS